MSYSDPQKPRLRLRSTWSKVWAKAWALQSLSHMRVPETYCSPGTFGEAWRWIESTSEPLRAVLKPNNSTHSRGVLYCRTADHSGNAVTKPEGWRPQVWDRTRNKHFIDVTMGRAHEIVGPTMDKVPDAYKWMVERFVTASERTWDLFGSGQDSPSSIHDGLFVPSPVFRVVVWKGAFHFGEIHVPTRASGGVGSLRRGALRYVFDHTGTVRKPPQLAQAPDWIERCDARANRKLYDQWVVPRWPLILTDVRTAIQFFGRKALYAIDFLIGKSSVDEAQAYFLEVEHSPNVRYLTLFNGFREGGA